MILNGKTISKTRQFDVWAKMGFYEKAFIEIGAVEWGNIIFTMSRQALKSYRRCSYCSNWKALWFVQFGI